MTNQELLTLYDNVASLTDNMVSAAQCHNWTLLATLEAQCSAHVQSIKENNAPVVLKEEERLRKVLVIKKILEDDRKIRDITQPRMAELTRLMSRSNTQSKLASMYQLDHRRSGIK